MLVNILVVYLCTYKIAEFICARDIVKKHICIVLRCNSLCIKETCTISTLLNYTFKFCFLIKCLLYCIIYKVLRNSEEVYMLHVKVCVFRIISWRCLKAFFKILESNIKSYLLRAHIFEETLYISLKKHSKTLLLEKI